MSAPSLTITNRSRNYKFHMVWCFRRVFEILLFGMIQYASIKIHAGGADTLFTPLYATAFSFILLRGPQLCVAFLIGSLFILFQSALSLTQNLALISLFSFMPLCFYALIRLSVGTVLPLITLKGLFRLALILLPFGVIIPLLETQIFHTTLQLQDFVKHYTSLLLFIPSMLVWSTYTPDAPNNPINKTFLRLTGAYVLLLFTSMLLANIMFTCAVVGVFGILLCKRNIRYGMSIMVFIFALFNSVIS